MNKHLNEIGLTGHEQASNQKAATIADVADEYAAGRGFTQVYLERNTSLQCSECHVKVDSQKHSSMERKSLLAISCNWRSISRPESDDVADPMWRSCRSFRRNRGLAPIR